MANDVIKNCIITKKDSRVLKYPNFNSFTECYPAVDIEANEIYSPCYGLLISDSNYFDKHALIVQYSGNICVKFSNLKSVTVDLGSVIVEGQLLGYANNYTIFEYLTSEIQTPAFREFLPNGLTAYKHDPMLILNGNVKFQNSFIDLNPPSIYQALYEDGRGEEHVL